MIPAVILARVSHPDQEEGHSPDAQLANSRAYAERKGMEVLQVFSITESSTKGDRPEFERMIAFIGRQKKRTALVVDCLDRLQRSFTHIPVLNALMEKDILEIHFIREGYCIDKDSNSMQKLMFNMGTLMAQSYVDQMKDNIKRSIKHKVDTGLWISKAPVGYRHEYDPQDDRAKKVVRKKGERADRRRSRIVIDTEQAHLVKRLFTEYATGTVSFHDLLRKSHEWGLHTDRGNKLALQTIVNIITNPFYYGMMRVKGKLYPHQHPTLIDKTLFDACQQVRERIVKPWEAVKKTRENFLLSGIVKCAVTGKKATCDIKKGRYVYLMTHDPANPAKKLWIKEEKVLRQIAAVFDNIILPESVLPEMLDYVSQTHNAEKTFHHEHTRALQLEKNELTGKLDRLADLLLEGHIVKEVYERKYQEITSRRDDINRQLTRSDKGDNSVKLALGGIMALASKTSGMFQSSNIEEKRHVLGLVFSNLSLEGSTLRYSLRKPFDTFEKMSGCPEWRRGCPPEFFSRHLTTSPKLNIIRAF